MEKLRICRERAGLSQKQVSIEVGVSGPTVSQWESGVKKPSLDNLLRLADLYKVSMDFLLDRSEESSNPNMLTSISLSSHEQMLIRAYRRQPVTVQDAICDILHIDHLAALKAN